MSDWRNPKRTQLEPRHPRPPHWWGPKSPDVDNTSAVSKDSDETTMCSTMKEASIASSLESEGVSDRIKVLGEAESKDVARALSDLDKVVETLISAISVLDRSFGRCKEKTLAVEKSPAAAPSTAAGFVKDPLSHSRRAGQQPSRGGRDSGVRVPTKTFHEEEALGFERMHDLLVNMKAIHSECQEQTVKEISTLDRELTGSSISSSHYKSGSPCEARWSAPPSARCPPESATKEQAAKEMSSLDRELTSSSICSSTYKSGSPCEARWSAPPSAWSPPESATKEQQSLRETRSIDSELNSAPAGPSQRKNGSPGGTRWTLPKPAKSPPDSVTKEQVFKDPSPHDREMNTKSGLSSESRRSPPPARRGLPDGMTKEHVIKNLRLREHQLSAASLGSPAQTSVLSPRFNPDRRSAPSLALDLPGRPSPVPQEAKAAKELPCDSSPDEPDVPSDDSDDNMPCRVHASGLHLEGGVGLGGMEQGPSREAMRPNDLIPGGEPHEFTVFKDAHRQLRRKAAKSSDRR